MSRPTYRCRRGAALALAVLIVGPAAGHTAQDEALLNLAAAKANERIPDIQSKLAAADETRFRLDEFIVEGKRLKVTGVFLDDPAKKDETKKEEESSPAQKALEEKLRTLVLKTIDDVVKDKKNEINFTFNFIKINGLNHPYPNILLQNACNAAGEKTPAADRVRFDKCRFDERGRLVLEGIRGQGQDVLDWLKGVIKDKFKDHPSAYRTVKGEKHRVEPVDRLAEVNWKLTPANLQVSFTATNDARYQRLRVDRLYFAYKPDLVPKPTEESRFQLVLDGIRLDNGKAATQDELTKQCTALWPERLKDNTNIAYSADSLTTNVVIPVKQVAALFQKAVAEDEALDGVRIDFALKFDPQRQLVVAGLRPPLNSGERATALQNELTRVFRETMSNSGESATKAALTKLAAGPGVSLAGLAEVNLSDVLNLVRSWAMSNKDDVRLSRLYFDKVGGLRLVCESPYKDNADIGTELDRVLTVKKLDFLKTPPTPPKGDEPAAEGARNRSRPAPAHLFVHSYAIAVAADDAADKLKLFQPQVIPRPPRNGFPTYESLTEVLRAEVARRDPSNPNKWKGVYIERGYFDKNNKYTLRGVVDRQEQNLELDRFLDGFRDVPAWQPYFHPQRNTVNLTVISMADLLLRVQRVTPAYEEFDGIQITGVDYVNEVDPKTKLETPVMVFTAHLANAASPALSAKLTQLAAVKLTELIAADTDHFEKRLPKGEKDTPNVITINGKTYRLVVIKSEPAQNDVAPHFQEGHFSNGYGSLFLSRANAAGFVESTSFLVKAREWINVGILHAPEQSSIWFLSAYYYYTIGDMELTRRDMRRVCQIEDPIDFNGGDQRRRRYEVAKDLQGEKRTELERLWVRTWREVNDGAKPMTMAATFAVTGRTLESLRKTNVPAAIIDKLAPLKGKGLLRPELVREIDGVLTPEEADQYRSQIMNHTTMVPGR